MQEKKLRRSVSNKKVLGVCGGFGKYFNIDPSFVRVIFLTCLLALSLGLWIYLICALIMPKEEEGNADNTDNVKKIYRSKKNSVLFGVCGGISNYFDIDVVIVRLTLVLLFLLAGYGLLFYIVAGIVFPIEPEI